MRPPRQWTPGAPEHGVVRFAREIAGAVHALAPDPDPDALHVHFTDRLFGAAPEQAATEVEALARRVRLTVTLHDVPQPSDGAMHGRRAHAYRRAVRAARGVTVNSEHEAGLLRAVDPGARPAVIRHPVDPLPAAARPTPDDDVALLGYVYPGKGHAEVIEAVAGHRGLGVVALGGPSSGHEADVQALTARAAALGVRFSLTGYLDETAVIDRVRRACVPVAAHQHISASGSIPTWIAAGRRPLVPRNAYTCEMAALRPGTLTLYDDLAAAIDAARRDPASTWWGDGADTGPALTDVAAAYLAWWAG